MKITIGKKIDEPKNINTYVLQATFMHGDADAYITEEAKIPKQEEVLLGEMVVVLQKMLNLPWNNAREAYEMIPEFKLFFSDEYLGPLDGEPAYDKTWPEEVTYELWNKNNLYSFVWPRDVTYNDILARLDGFKVFYYDNNGIKYEVIIEDL